MTAVPLPTPRRAHGSPPLPGYVRRVGDPAHSARARGEGMLWLCGGALVVCVCMVVGLLGLVVYQGGATFWPQPAVELQLRDGRTLLGEVSRRETWRPAASALAAMSEPDRRAAQLFLQAHDGTSTRQLLRTGNFDLDHTHFQWVEDFATVGTATPEWALVVERQSWGRFYGTPIAFVRDGTLVAQDSAASWAEYQRRHDAALTRVAEQRRIAAFDIGELSQREWDARLVVKRAELRLHELPSGDPRLVAAQRALASAKTDQDRVLADCAAKRQQFEQELARIEHQNAREALRLRTSAGQEKDLLLSDIVRAYPANQVSLLDKVGIYLSRWYEFLTTAPRENNEGGVWPAIVGTVLMTLLMSICVVPFGVLAALYLREYAKAGFVVSAVRIAVNNLAGVPSIVFGVFGLGFFCYIVGGWIDTEFYPELLPSPTFGKGALVWASFTLALLTLPVVIVATEEALAAVPGSMREGSYACGASKWQTIRRIVLPRAMPGVMTGAILAMARGAGEVAPLMLVGAAKLAPELPLDGTWPYLHPGRSFMHLGFNIYDLGFQSQNSEAAKPMVYTTTLLLIAIITLLNVLAIWLRNRLRRRFVGAQF